MTDLYVYFLVGALILFVGYKAFSGRKKNGNAGGNKGGSGEDLPPTQEK